MKRLAVFFNTKLIFHIEYDDLYSFINWLDFLDCGITYRFNPEGEYLNVWKLQ